MSKSFEIPIIDLKAQYAELQPAIRAAVDEVLDGQQFILGPAVTGFETRMASYLGCGHAVGVASGSDALLLALMALDLKPGDGVIVPPFTFFSTVSAITRTGATPIFVDVDLRDYLLTHDDVSNYIDRQAEKIDGRLRDVRTGTEIKALLPVHLFGRCCAMEALLEIARGYGLTIVEDVAQACGARTMVSGAERFAGTIGDYGCFSFFPSKNLGGYGDAGLVSTDLEAGAARVRMLRMHGESAKYHHQLVGINSRLDSLQAAILSVKQAFLDGWCESRIWRAAHYRRLFLESGLLRSDRVMAIPDPGEGREHVFNNYVIRAARRDDLKVFLAELGIQSEIYYPVPLHLQRCFAGLGHGPGDFPVAELISNQVLALPLYPEITPVQQERVVGGIVDFFRQ